MSGIAGIIRLDGRSAGADSLKRMAGAMAHRGRRGVTLWMRAGAGFSRLITRDHDSDAALPAGRRGHVVAADVRLDNRDELVGKLHNSAFSQEATDAKLLAAAFDRWGADCVDHLVGAFAFVVWDHAERRLFCARDHLGVKPFYYAHVPGRVFAFASEIKAILTLPEVTSRLNEVRIADYLSFNSGDVESTIYLDVRRMPPAHTATIEPTGFRLKKYWSLTGSDEPSLLSKENRVDRFRELFTEAVRCRLPSEGEIASELSGGLDSSAVTCVARNLLDERPLHTVSLTYDRFPEADESVFIKLIARGKGIIPHYESGVLYGRLSCLDDVYTYVDEPGTAAGNHHIVWQRCRMARDAGCSVLLTGYDGDTVVGHGYDRVDELLRSGKWQDARALILSYVRRLRTAEHVHANDQMLVEPDQLLSSYVVPYLDEIAGHRDVLRFASVVYALRQHFGVRQTDLYRRFWRRMFLAGRTEDSGRNAKLGIDGVPAIIRHDFARRIDLAERLSQTRPALSYKEHFESGRKVRALEGLDQYGAAHGIDVRHPFMDVRLIEFCSSLPNEDRFHDGWTRYILRKAMDGVVPRDVSWRVGKTNVSAPSNHALFETDGDLLRELVEAPGPMAEYVDVDHLRRLFGRGRNQPGEDINRLALVAALSLWFERYGPDAASPADA